LMLEVLVLAASRTLKVLPYSTIVGTQLHVGLGPKM
jgi:hypothetical protein